MTDDKEEKLTKYINRIAAGEVLSPSDRKHYEALCNEWLDEEEREFWSHRVSEFI